jgi:rhodanese-related sulfurtransferase
MSATSKTAAHLVAEAKARVASLSPQEAAGALRRGDALLVDLRETEERLEHGSIRGAVHAPRGMLEFFADPTSGYFRQEFDPNRRTILFCASGARAALAAEALQSLGYADVAYLAGGLRAWREAGLSIETGETGPERAR